MKDRLKEIVAARVRTGDRRVLQTVRAWSTREGQFEAFYFRSEVCRGENVPVYAVSGIPAGRGPFPSVLHYHGGGQTANPEHVAQLVRQGYAAISFDWTGPWVGREHVTHWNGCAPRYSGIDPDESLLIRALTAARQALTILADHPQVDASRLGQFGISWGGFQTWLLNTVDDRLRAAVAIYGCGITRSQVLFHFRNDLTPKGSLDPDAWTERYNPIHYAHEQKAPVLFLNGTNDFFGWMSTFSRLAGELDARHRAAFAPHFNHGIGTLNSTFLAWLDHHLRGGGFPARPTVTGEWTRRGIELCSPALPDAKTATFHVAAAVGTGPDYLWMPVAAERSGPFFVARTSPASLGAARVVVYIHQRLPHGIEQSSFPLRIAGSKGSVPVRMGGGLPLASDLWYGPASTDPLTPFAPLRPSHRRGSVALKWSTGSDLHFSFNTRVIALPRWRLRTGARFLCRLHGPVADPIAVAALQYAGSPRERRFQGSFTRAALAHGIPIGALKDPQGKSLRTGITLSNLSVDGTTQRPATVWLETAKIL